MQLRKMNPKDFQNWKEYCINDYAKELVKYEGINLSTALMQSNKEFDSSLPKGINTMNSYIYEAYEGDCNVGFIWLQDKGDNTYFIVYLYVYDTYRNKRYGKQILQLIEKIKDIELIMLHVFSKNVVAINLYLSQGYNFMDVETNPNSLYMRKYISKR